VHSEECIAGDGGEKGVRPPFNGSEKKKRKDGRKGGEGTGGGRAIDPKAQETLQEAGKKEKCRVKKKKEGGKLAKRE